MGCERSQLQLRIPILQNLINEAIVHLTVHPTPPTWKKQPRKVGVLLDLRVRIKVYFDLREELVNGGCCLEAKRTREGNKVVLPLV